MSIVPSGPYTLDSESIGVELFFNIGTPFSPTIPAVTISRPPRNSMKGRNCLAWLANRSLAWSILNLDETFSALHAAETALIRAYADKNFKLARSGLQGDLNKARKRDCDNLLKRLDKLVADSEANIICALQSNEGGRPYQLKELATAFTKRIRTPMTEEAGVPDISPFLRKTVAGLQRISNRPPDFEIPPWSVTSVDVDFAMDDARLIGRGAFGRVVEGEWNGKVVAVKELRSSNNESVAVDSIRREVQVWSSLSHPNILPFYGACLESPKPFIVSEYCCSGNALRYIKGNPQVDLLKLLYGIASGMSYLHDQGVIHGDLKASNILISDSGEALIADFGLSQIQDQVSSSINITRTSTERVGGTARWMAPELLVGKGLNKPADVYSFALTAWELYTKGGVPYGNVFNARQLSVLVQKGERPERPFKMDDGVWKLTQKCWRLEPTERPNFVEIEWTLGVLMSRQASGDISFMSRVTRGRGPPPPLPVNVTSIEASREEPFSTETPPRHVRKFSMSTRGDGNGKASFLRGLVNVKVTAFPTPTAEVACISPKSRHSEKNRPPSDELGFLMHAQKLASFPHDVTSDYEDLPPIESAITFLFDHSLNPDGVSEIVNESGLIPAVLKCLSKPANSLKRENELLLGLLANLACQGTGRAVLIAQPQTIPVLCAYLPTSSSPSAQEQATRCLYNLSTDDASHGPLVEVDGVIPLLGLLLSDLPLQTTVKNVMGCLTNLSLKDPGRSLILDMRDAVDGILHALGPETDDITKEQALLCLGNLSVDPEYGVATLLTHSGLLPRLSTCLHQDSPTPAIKAQTLRCLRNLAKSVVSHGVIADSPKILSTVCDVLALRRSSNQQKYALHFVHRFTSSYIGKEWLQGERQVWASLRWYIDNGSSEDHARASSCLKLIEDIQ